jgi:hypothetical protein
MAPNAIIDASNPHVKQSINHAASATLQERKAPPRGKSSIGSLMAVEVEPKLSSTSKHHTQHGQSSGQRSGLLQRVTRGF